MTYHEKNVQIKAAIIFYEGFYSRSRKHPCPWLLNVELNCFYTFAKCTSIDFSSSLFWFFEAIQAILCTLMNHPLNYPPHTPTFLVRTDVKVLKSFAKTRQYTESQKNMRFCTQTIAFLLPKKQNFPIENFAIH